MNPFFPMVFVFVLLLVLFIGGFVLVFPLTRRLGAYLEMLIERRHGPIPDRKRMEVLEGELQELKAEVERLAERQSFVDNLLSDDTEVQRLGEGA